MNLIQSLAVGLDPTAFASGLLLTSAKAGLLIAMAWAMLRIVKSAPATMRHAVWTLVFAATLALPIVELMAPAWQPLPPSQVDSRKMVLPESKGDLPAFDQASSESNQVPAASAPRSSGPIDRASESTAGNRSWLGWPWMIGAGLWGMGVAWLLMRLAWGTIRLHQLRNRATEPIDDSWHEPNRTVRARCGMKGNTGLLVIDAPAVPMVVGLRRPVIILPKSANQWSQQSKRAVLAHEYAHLLRADLTIDLMARVTCILHWFNPLVWVALKQLNFERERACDDAVIGAGIDPADYASQVLHVASSWGHGGNWNMAAAMARASDLEGRLLSILDQGRSRRQVTKRETALFSFVTLVFLLPLAAVSLERRTEASRVVPAAEIEVTDSMESKPVRLTSEWTVEDFVQALRAQDKESRELAENALQARRGDDPVLNGVVDTLTPELAADEAMARHAALWQLEKTRSPRVFDLLVDLKQDEDPLVRGGLAGALGALGDPRSVQHLTSLLEDDVARVRKLAVQSLGRFRGADVIAALDRASEDDDPLVREWVARSLATSSDDLGAAVLQALLKDDNSRVREWAVRGFFNVRDKKAVPGLVNALSDEGSNVREWAARVLMSYGDVRAVNPLIDALADPEPDVREWSARALGSLGDPVAADALADATFDDNAEVREWAVRALMDMNSERAVVALLDALRDERDQVREWAARALVSKKDSQVARGLIAALRDPAPNVREWSARSLGYIADPMAVNPLKQAALDPETEIQEWATRALSMIKGGEATAALIELAGFDQPALQYWAIRGLGNREGGDVRDALKATILDLRVTDRARAEAVKILARTAGTDVTPLLIRLKNGDPSTVVRSAAGEALDRLSKSEK